MRLDRLLVTLALGTRSQLQPMIRKGRLTVNGEAVRDPALNVEPGKDEICLDGQKLDTRLTLHLMLNKPAGILTAARDKKAPTVMDLLPPKCQTLGCMPVGRLDKDTTGLLLFTTDGELAHRLLSPKRHVNKIYWAQVDGPLDERDAEAFLQGLDLGDFTALPGQLEIIASAPDYAQARVTVQEGKFHQVKRMFEARGRTVTQLHRERFGPLELDDNLAPGQYRELTETEAAQLMAAAEETRHE